MLSLLALLALAAVAAAAAPPRRASVRVGLGRGTGPLDLTRMALGQGGLSSEPMWDDRVAEIRSLRPALIRLFIQEYFDLLPAPGKYDFDTLDRSVDTILRTGATPLMCICFKPKALFPIVDQDVVEPSDYAQWEELVYRLVKHYRDRQAGIRYWEVGNEPDIGESGGCPYRFQPESYVRYYAHTVDAVLRADPTARVGGPALANSRSAILPALLAACESQNLPLHFVSWHTYSSDPCAVRSTVDYVHGLLAAHPGLDPETVLDEWNMDLGSPPADARFQPCYVLETVWQMLDAGLDWSCYYHIRDWHVRYEEFEPFMSPQGVAFMSRWWNRMPQFDGLFDYQNGVRPAFFSYKLLSRMTGERLALESSDEKVHGFASRDERYRLYNVLIWNYSAEPIDADLNVDGVPGKMLARQLSLDANAPSSDENVRLNPAPVERVEAGSHRYTVTLEPYGVHLWSFE